MKRSFFGVMALAVVLGNAAAAWAVTEGTPGTYGNVYGGDLETGAQPSLDHLRLYGIHGYSWKAVGRDELVLWATPFRPYLVKLDHPSIDLPFAQRIGFTTTNGTVYTNFDSVVVRGLRYRIVSIQPLDRETARGLSYHSRHDAAVG